MNLPKRKPTRLANFDYSTNGAYFITICTYNRKRFFGNIVGQGLAPAENRLSIYGQIAEEQLLLLENRYQNIKIYKYVIMPNHIHIIISINNTAGASPCPTISNIICTYKSLTSRICRQNGLNFSPLSTTISYAMSRIITKYGNTLKTILRSGARTGFSTRIKKQSPQLSVEGFVLLYIQNCGCQAEINQQ